VTLTPRQADVIGLLARGLTSHETGRLLGISHTTVKDHARDARLQLGARNTAHAVAISLREGLIVG
jgi:LuxR family transcriptional regulator